MKRIIFSIVILLLGNMCVSAQETSYSDLQECFDDELGIHFRCHPDWQVQFNEAADIFVISEDPAVVLTIAREKNGMVSLEQITKDWLLEKGLYADGFAVERTVLGDGIDMIKVKAFDRDDKELRLTDYYFLHGGYLYKILFSVSPVDAWGEYQFVLRDVIDGVHFADNKITVNKDGSWK